MQNTQKIIVGAIVIGLILVIGAGFIVATNKEDGSNQPQVQLYKLSEVAMHSQETDCWMVIEGKVYNVTDFISKHPGGKTILNGCGKDATILFNERPTNDKGPHPETAKNGLVNFYIGELK